MREVFVQHKAEIWDDSSNGEYHHEVVAGEDFLYISYKEKGRAPQDGDSIEIPIDLAETLAKTILKLVKMKGEN